MPSTPPSEVRNAASIRNWNRISARRAPSALRTPISRVRSVTEIDMIAITPMPPTISAIDEMTISARKVALADLIPQLQDRVLRERCRSRSARRACRPWRMRITRSTSAMASSCVDALARHHGDLNRQDRAAVAPRPTVTPRRPNMPLVGRVRNDDEVVLAEVEAADARPLVEDADDREALGADAHRLADRIGAGRREQRLIRRVAEHDDVLAVLHFGAGEEPAGRASGCCVPSAKFSVVPKTTIGRGLQVAVEHALAGSAGRPAPSSMSTSWIVVGLLLRWRARRTPSGSAASAARGTRRRWRS